MELDVHSNSDVSGLAAEASAEVAMARAAVDCGRKQEWKLVKLLRKQRRADVTVKIPEIRIPELRQQICLEGSVWGSHG